MLDYAIESFEACIPEFNNIAKIHYEEIAAHQDAFPLDLDYDRYISLEHAGILLFITVRIDGTLVGYYMAMVMPHLHCRSSLTAFTDYFYLLPTYRHGNAGIGLLRFTIHTVRDMGVQQLFAACKLTHDLDPLMTRLGFTEIERVYHMIFTQNGGR